MAGQIRICLKCGIKLQIPLESSFQALRNNHFVSSNFSQTTGNWKKVISERIQQVVLIEHKLGMGAGIIVQPNGLILTNKHVVEGISTCNVTFSDKTILPAIVLNTHPEKDLAVLKAASDNMPYFNFRKDIQTNAEVGDEVIGIGHPHGLRFTTTRGIISVLDQEFAGAQIPRRRIPR